MSDQSEGTRRGQTATLTYPVEKVVGFDKLCERGKSTSATALRADEQGGGLTRPERVVVAVHLFVDNVEALGDTAVAFPEIPVCPNHKAIVSQNEPAGRAIEAETRLTNEMRLDRVRDVARQDLQSGKEGG